MHWHLQVIDNMLYSFCLEKMMK